MADDYVTGSGLIQIGSSAICTLLIPTPARPRIRITHINIGFNGTNNAAAGVLAQICKASGTPSGTPIGSAYGPTATDPGAPTSVISGVLTPSSATPGSWTTPPTQGAILWERVIPPVSDYPEWIPLGKEIVAPVSSFIGIFLTAPNAVGVYSWLGWYE